MLELLLQTGQATLQNIFNVFFDSESRVFWLYLLTSLLLGFGVLLWHSAHADGPLYQRVRTAFTTLFDPGIWLHRSALIDYACYILNGLLGTGLYLLSAFIGTWLGLLFKPVMMALGGGEALGFAAGVFPLGIYTLFSLALLDLGIYVGHYLLHRIPVLWEFHKIHHSAQVLTPLSVYRVHPFDFMFAALVSGVFVGFVSAVGLFVFGAEVSPAKILGLNIGVFMFNLLGANLRHSHVWLPYPKWLSQILISPAQHQVHHSKSARHYDRNFGSVFALWDWCFHTLYIPDRNEKITYGLADGEDDEYQTLKGLYFLPLKKAWRCLFKRP